MSRWSTVCYPSGIPTAATAPGERTATSYGLRLPPLLLLLLGTYYNYLQSIYCPFGCYPSWEPGVHTAVAIGIPTAAATGVLGYQLLLPPEQRLLLSCRSNVYYPSGVSTTTPPWSTYCPAGVMFATLRGYLLLLLLDYLSSCWSTVCYPSGVPTATPSGVPTVPSVATPRGYQCYGLPY